MKLDLAFVAILSALLTGCVAYPYGGGEREQGPDQHYQHRDHDQHGQRDQNGERGQRDQPGDHGYDRY